MGRGAESFCENRSHFWLEVKNSKLRRKCTVDDQKFGMKISLARARLEQAINNAVCDGTNRGYIPKG
jgi:hypothetical protein